MSIVIVEEQFSQYIRLIQHLVERGRERVRASRRTIAGEDRVRVEAMAKMALADRPRPS